MFRKEFEEKLNQNYTSIFNLNKITPKTFDKYYKEMKGCSKKQLIEYLYDLSKKLNLIDTIINEADMEDDY